MVHGAIPLILASTSRYRRELLTRLGVPFAVESPHVDEMPRPAEGAADLATRLAEAKARAVARAHPHALVMGSDQVAECGGLIFGKPGNFERACSQLDAASGAEVIVHTAVSLVGEDRAISLSHRDVTRVRFRPLDRTEIEEYVRRDQPYDCAGSFRSEGLGVTLFDAMETQDPTALVGLPLIWVTKALRLAGLNVLTKRT
jgi:septum formation protein